MGSSVPAFPNPSQPDRPDSGRAKKGECILDLAPELHGTCNTHWCPSHPKSHEPMNCWAAPSRTQLARSPSRGHSLALHVLGETLVRAIALCCDCMKAELAASKDRFSPTRWPVFWCCVPRSALRHQASPSTLHAAKAIVAQMENYPIFTSPSFPPIHTSHSHVRTHIGSNRCEKYGFDVSVSCVWVNFFGGWVNFAVISFFLSF